MKSDTLVRLGFVSLLALAPASFGVTAHDGFDPGKSPIVRPEGIWDISKYVYLLSALFHRPVSTIERQYSKELPQALDAVVKTKDESRVADVLGELFTTVSEEQKKLIGKIQKLNNQHAPKKSFFRSLQVAYHTRSHKELQSDNLLSKIDQYVNSQKIVPPSEKEVKKTSRATKKFEINALKASPSDKPQKKALDFTLTPKQKKSLLHIAPHRLI